MKEGNCWVFLITMYINFGMWIGKHPGRFLISSSHRVSRCWTISRPILLQGNVEMMWQNGWDWEWEDVYVVAKFTGDSNWYSSCTIDCTSMLWGWNRKHWTIRLSMLLPAFCFHVINRVCCCILISTFSINYQVIYLLYLVIWCDDKNSVVSHDRTNLNLKESC